MTPVVHTVGDSSALMNAEPRVSIVITYYNEPREFLIECVQSALAQTINQWEAIIVDDGSDQPTAQEIETQFGDPRIRVIRHDGNRGVAAARNTGFRAARASWILLLDADDRLDPGYMEATLAACAEHPDADWVLTDFQLFGASNDIWRFPVPLPPPCPTHLYYVGAGVLLQKRVWEAVGGYAEGTSLLSGADLDFWLTAFEQGMRPTHVATPLYLYRRHSGSMTYTNAMYDSYSEIELIYRRHRTAFEVLGSDCALCKSPNRAAAFRVGGYLTSSIASLRRRERGRALRLALHGFVLQPTNADISWQVLRILFPEAVLTALSRVKRLLLRAWSPLTGSSRPFSRGQK